MRFPTVVPKVEIQEDERKQLAAFRASLPRPGLERERKELQDYVAGLPPLGSGPDEFGQPTFRAPMPATQTASEPAPESVTFRAPQPASVYEEFPGATAPQPIAPPVSPAWAAATRPETSPFAYSGPRYDAEPSRPSVWQQDIRPPATITPDAPSYGPYGPQSARTIAAPGRMNPYTADEELPSLGDIAGAALTAFGKAIEPGKVWVGDPLADIYHQSVEPTNYPPGTTMGDISSWRKAALLNEGIAPPPEPRFKVPIVQPLVEAWQRGGGNAVTMAEQLGEAERKREETNPYAANVSSLLNPLGFAGPAEVMAAGRLAKGAVRAAPKVLPALTTAARAVDDVARNPEVQSAVRRVLPGGTVQTIEAAPAVATKRYYHGTGSTFDVPDAAKFDANGLYGPGYYLTDSPEVAGSYATNRASDIDRWSRKMSQSEAQDIVRQINSHWVQPTTLKPEEIAGRPFDLVASELVNRLGREKSLGFNNAVNIINDSFPDFIGGQQLRAVSVPENLRLLDVNAPVSQEVVRQFEQMLGAPLPNAFSYETMRMEPPRTGGLLREAINAALVDKGIRSSAAYNAESNRILQAAGYDGIRYQGGKRIPMRGADGNPIEHEAIVIFPESLPKITNALSGKPMGSPPEVGGAVLGGVAGSTQGETPEERAHNALLGAATGGIAGYAMRKGVKPGATVEDVSGKLGAVAGMGDEAAKRYEFIRPTTKAESVGGTARSRGFNSIPAKPDAEVVYRPYGEQGAGYYYEIAETVPDTLPEWLATEAIDAIPEAQVGRAQMEAAPVAVEPKPPRTPLWEGKTAAEPPLRGGPPAPPIEPPAEGLPSGRMPGGADKAIELEPRVSEYEKLQAALTPEKVTVKDRAITAKNWLLREFYDRNDALRFLEKETAIPAHKLAQVVPGSIAYGEDIVRRRVLPIVRSAGEDVKHLEEYMVAMRAQDVAARFPSARLPGGMTGAAGAQQAIDTLAAKLGPQRYGKIEKSARKLWLINDEEILKPLVDEGMLSKQSYTEIKSAHPHYIDFHRSKFSVSDEIGRILGKPEASVSSNRIERMALEGSTEKLDQPLARTEAQIIRTRQLVSRNRAARTIVAALMDVQEKKGGELVKILKPGDAAERTIAEDTISFFHDGKQYAAQVPREYAALAKGLDAESSNSLLRVMRALAAPLRGGAVTYNPAFVIVNPVRDAVSALFREKLIPLSPDYIKGWAAAITKNADFSDAAEAGALMSGIVDTMRSTDALKRVSQLGSIEVKSAKDALLVVPRLIRQANLVSEQATRIATYRKLRGAGIDKLEAAVRARDVTVDFAKAGNTMKVINQVIPFANAGVQGAANTLRTLRYNPKRALVTSTPLGMASVMAYLWNQRFETANQIPDYEYAQNWIIQVGEGSKEVDPKLPNKPAERFPVYVKIPKGPLGAFLTAPVEMLLRAAWAKDDRSITEQFLAAAMVAGQSLSPVEPSFSGALPPIIGTGTGLTTGVDAFRRERIVPRGEEERPPELQYGPETSETAVALGERFKVSPRMIEFAIKDYTAGVGGQALWLTDLALGALGYDPTVYGESRKRELSDTEELSRTPVVSRFIGTRGTHQSNIDWERLRDSQEESKRSAAGIEELKKLGVTFGPVGDRISVADNLAIVLTTKERKALQDETTTMLDELATRLVARAEYQQLPDTQKLKVVQRVMDAGREAARQNYLRSVPRDELKRRLVESLPVAVKR